MGFDRHPLTIFSAVHTSLVVHVTFLKRDTTGGQSLKEKNCC